MPLTLTVVGSADAFSSAGRGNACYLVEDDAGAFCVDFGPTSMRGLKARGFEPDRLDAVLLTHLHGDHFGGLHLLLVDALYRARRTRPLTIAGPRGTRACVESWYRLAFGGESRRWPFARRFVEIEPGASARIGGRQVRTWAAKHMEPQEGALLLRIQTGGATLAFTGDTAWTEDLPRLAEGADLLVCECTNREGDAGNHLSWKLLTERLGELEARRILLSHLSLETRPLAARARKPARVRFADDGMRVRIGGPSRSTTSP